MDILKIFTFKFYIRKIKNTLKSLFKRTVMIILMFLISFLFTLIVSILIKTPSIQEKNLSLYKKENNLYTNLFNCNIYFSDDRHYDMHIGKQCVYLNSISYSIVVEMEIMNMNELKSNYIETKIDFHSNKSKEHDFNIDKVSYIKEEKSLISIIYDFLQYIPKKLGYFQGNVVRINYIDELDNRIFQLSSLDLIIIDSQIEIKTIKLTFLPNLSFLQSFISKIYIFSIFSVFIFSFIFQIAVYFLYNIISYLYNTVKFLFEDDYIESSYIDEEEKESYDDIHKIKTN